MCCKVKKVKKGIAVCRQACHHRYGNSHAIWDHTVLPATRPWSFCKTCVAMKFVDDDDGRGDIPAFTPAKAGTQFSDPGGMQGWVDLGGWLEMVYPHNGHPSWTNRARCSLTLLMRPTTLTTTPSRHPPVFKVAVDCFQTQLFVQFSVVAALVSA